MTEIHGSYRFARFDDLPPDLWRWAPEFTPREMACKGTGQLVVVPAFMDKLYLLRVACDFPFIVNSAYRSASHNAREGGRPGSAHLLGRAVDIAVHGERAWTILVQAPGFGFTGIGARQHGPHGRRFVHLDDAPALRADDVEDGGVPRPRPYFWTYA